MDLFHVCFTITGRFTVWLVAVSSALLLAADAAKLKNIPNPDFTKGEPIPEGATKDWTLGATGCRGWMHSKNLETRDARQIRVTQVADGSPADGVFEVGDVILGVGAKAFDEDARMAFGRALTFAESEVGGGKLELLRWRGGEAKRVTVRLPVLGTYSSTAPYDCPKSARIFELGCAALAKAMSAPSYKPSPISRSWNALALLASGNEEYLPILKREATWAAAFRVEQFSVWHYGYVISFLAEYVMVTGDVSVMPGLRELALASARGQSMVGSWGHKFAGEDGRLVGYGMMNAPGIPLTISLVLAREAGVDDPEIREAIERSAKLLRFYIGKGAVPYGDHHPWIQHHEDNGKCGMAAVLFNLLGEPEGSKFFSRMSLASHGAERETGHTGNFWNMAWAMPGVNQSGPQATGAWMKEFGAWYADLARTHEGMFPHQGPPQATPDATGRWDATGAYLLAYAMPLKKLLLTGRKAAIADQVTAEQAAAILDAGRGWSKSDKRGTYDGMAEEELIERLGSWSPVVRERAAIALARRGETEVSSIIQLLDHPSLDMRLGACQALAEMRRSAAPAVPKLRDICKTSNDLWLRVKAADALAAIGEDARVAIPDMLDIIIRGPSVDDPRGMEQRFFCFALFNKMLSKSLDGVDRKKLLEAMRAALRNEDGRARASVTKVYPLLREVELRHLMGDLHHSVVAPSPSGIMFADVSRMEGLKLLAEHNIDAGMDATMDWLMHQNHWGSQKRTPALLGILLSYGVHAQRCIPALEQLAADFDAGIPSDFPKALSVKKAEAVREAIAKLKQTKDKPQLNPLLR